MAGEHKVVHLEEGEENVVDAKDIHKLAEGREVVLFLASLLSLRGAGRAVVVEQVRQRRLVHAMKRRRHLDAICD